MLTLTFYGLFFLFFSAQQMAKFAACACILLLTIICHATVAKESHDEDEETIPEVTKPVYVSPVPTGFAYLAEHFDDRERFNQTWQLSEAKKEGIDEDIAKYDGRYLYLLIVF